MIIRSISLQNFRSHKKQEFKFPNETTLVVGPNTSGKTNLLEAIYLLATGRSFRAGVEAEMIKYGQEVARVSGVVLDGEMGSRRAQKSTSVPSKNSVPSVIRGVSDKRSLCSESTELEIILTIGQVGGQKVAKKRYLVNGIGKRMMDFVGRLRCVLFGPEDLEIVVNSPSIRRDYLDSVLEQVDREYRRANLSYQKGLRQRNRLLEQIRDEGRPKSTLFFWNKLLLENGAIITQKREEFIDFINAQPDYFYDLLVSYQKNIISPARLEKYEGREIAAGMTLVGPHRDDFEFRVKEQESRRVKERSLHAFGSRGEQRTAVFSLKLAELEFITQKTEDPSTGSGQGRPVLLLDDILSELDKERRKRLIEVIPRQQTIITTTELGLIEEKYRQKLKLIKL